MDIRIAIVDDRKEDQICLKEQLIRFFSMHKKDNIRIDMFPSAEEFLPEFQPGSYQLVFLDIVMDQMNGIELARELRRLDALLLIVFQTTSREYAFHAFPVHPFDYLMKPCRPEELDGVMEEALRVIRIGDPEVKIISSRGSFNVPLRTICAVVSAGHNVELMLLENQKLVSTETFKSLSAKLEEDPRFLNINRGILINMDQVLMPVENGMKMKDGSWYPIRVNGKASVLSAFSQYMISRVDRRDRA